MLGRRMLYLIALLGGLVFYWAYREWLSWVFLLLLLLVPLFSFLVSLPAMLTCRATVRSPAAVELGEDAEVFWLGHSVFPLPTLDGKVMARNVLTTESLRVRSGELLPTEHCGLLELTLHKPRCNDYLGLFSLPVGKRSSARVLVRPKSVPLDKPPDMTRYQINAWVPKPGGGFSENHELRLYRPGDNLRQVHWKLSAKTGKLIYRESMEAVRSRMLLTLELCGSGKELDFKLGRLQWMSGYLLRCELPHTIQCLTGQGVLTFAVSTEQDTLDAVDALLCTPVVNGQVEGDYLSALWHYHIGGDDIGA